MMVKSSRLRILKIYLTKRIYFKSVNQDILAHFATIPVLSVNLGTDVEAVVFQNALMSFATLSKDVFMLLEKCDKQLH